MIRSPLSLLTAALLLCWGVAGAQNASTYLDDDISAGDFPFLGFTNSYTVTQASDSEVAITGNGGGAAFENLVYQLTDDEGAAVSIDLGATNRVFVRARATSDVTLRIDAVDEVTDYSTNTPGQSVGLTTEYQEFELDFSGGYTFTDFGPGATTCLPADGGCVVPSDAIDQLWFYVAPGAGGFSGTITIDYVAIGESPSGSDDDDDDDDGGTTGGAPLFVDDGFDDDPVNFLGGGLTAIQGDGQLAISSTGGAFQFANFQLLDDEGAPTSVDLTAGDRTVYFRARATNAPVNVRVDLVDAAGFRSTLAGARVDVTSEEFAVYSITYGDGGFPNLNDGGFGGTPCDGPPCPVDVTDIVGLQIYFNDAAGDYVGTVTFDYFAIGGMFGGEDDGGEECLAEAGTTSTSTPEVSLVDGQAEISGSADGNAVVPDGFATAFVLTMGDELVIEDFNLTGTFTVDMAGEYRIHVLVGNPADLLNTDIIDLEAAIEAGVTAVEAIALLDANDVCYALDVEGALVTVSEEEDVCDVDAGAITFADGSTTATIIVDGTPDPLEVVQTGNPSGESATFVITDAEANILAIPPGSGPFDLDGAGVGTCLIWYLVFDGELEGAAVGANATDLSGCFELSNPLEVIRNPADDGGDECEAEAGTTSAAASSVALADSTATISGTNDGNAVVPMGYELAYVLTMGDDLIIQDFNTSGTFAVSMAGTFRIHTLVANIDGDPAEDALDLSVVVPGETPAAAVLALLEETGICAALDVAGAPVEVTTGDDDDDDDDDNGGVSKGRISSPNGDSPVAVCSNGDLNTTVTVELEYETPVGQVAYVLTDEDFNILLIQDDATFDVSGNAPGIYHVFAFNYTGNILVGPGSSVFGIRFSDADFLISQNCIILDVFDDCTDGVVPTIAKGEIATPDGETRVEVCSTEDTGSGSTVTAELGYDIQLGQVAYVLTDSNFVILAIQDDPTFDFSDVDPAKYHIWAYNYTGSIVAEPGQPLFGTRFSDDEFLISQNCIVVNVGEGCTPACEAVAGTTSSDQTAVTLANGTATVSGSNDGNAVVPEGYELAYVLTMGDDLVIANFNTTGTFEVTMAGEYRVHTLVANIDGAPAANALDLSVVMPGVTTAAEVLALIEANGICAALDAAGALVTVEAAAPGITTGTIATPVGGDPGDICVSDDDDDDTVTVDLGFEITLGQVAYVLTDSNFIILRIQEDPTFDFSDAAPGTYHLWAYNYTGNILVGPGSSVFGIRFSDEEFLISQNCIIVNITDDCPSEDDGFAFTAAPVSSQELIIRAEEPTQAPTLVDVRISRADGFPVKVLNGVPEASLAAYTVDLDAAGGIYFVSIVRNGVVTTERVVFQ